jgi:hypothetical protein
MTKKKLKEIKNDLGRFLANDPSEHDAIIDILLKAKEDTPDESLDYIEGISVWEKIEGNFTVIEFCNLIDL